MSTDPHSLHTLEHALSSPWADRHVTVRKTVTKGRFHGVSVEQSDIAVAGSSHTCPQWRSVCFESFSKAKLEEVLKCPVKGSTMSVGDCPIQGSTVAIGEWLKAIPGSIVQGYPAFIMEPSHMTAPSQLLEISSTSIVCATQEYLQGVIQQ